MVVVYILCILIPIIVWVWIGLSAEDSNNNRWNDVQKKLFNEQHYEEIRKRKAYEQEVKKYSQSIRDKWRTSGLDVDDYINKEEDDEV